jgi:hypothetical protein
MTRSFIHIDRRDGIWWLVNAQGEPFFSVGVNHIQANCWLAPYNRNATLNRYGRDFVNDQGQVDFQSKATERWIGSVLRMLDAWGFNTLGMHTPIPFRLFKDRLPYVASTSTKGLAYYQFRFGEDRFPDIFSEAFEHHVRQRVRETCEAHRHEPNLLGYAYTDIPAWVIPPRYLETHPEWKVIHPWVDDLRCLPAHTGGKQVWMRVLRDRYTSPVEAARVHGVRAESWDALAETVVWPSPAEATPASRDNVTMLEAMAERWYRLHFTLIRQHDPHHLILGDKLVDFPDWLLPIVTAYVDVLFVQHYAPFGQSKPLLIRLYEATNKPIINGDGSFAVLKPPQQTHVKGYKVESLAAVGEHYYAYMRGLSTLPFVLGWHHCGFMEQWDGAKPPGKPNENGFLDPFEMPYSKILERIIDANRHVMDWHRHAGANTLKS